MFRLVTVPGHGHWRMDGPFFFLLKKKKDISIHSGKNAWYASSMVKPSQQLLSVVFVRSSSRWWHYSPEPISVDNLGPRGTIAPIRSQCINKHCLGRIVEGFGIGHGGQNPTREPHAIHEAHQRSVPLGFRFVSSFGYNSGCT